MINHSTGTTIRSIPPFTSRLSHTHSPHSPLIKLPAQALHNVGEDCNVCVDPHTQTQSEPREWCSFTGLLNHWIAWHRNNDASLSWEPLQSIPFSFLLIMRETHSFSLISFPSLFVILIILNQLPSCVSSFKTVPAQLLH